MIVRYSAYMYMCIIMLHNQQLLCLFCQVIISLQAKESSNEPLSIPNSGGRNKGVKR